MPFLAMDDNGEIYEVDSRYDHTNKIGRKPYWSNDSNVQALSVVERPEVIRDRIALDAIEKLQEQIVEKQYKREQNRKEKLNKEIQKELEAIAKLQEKIDYLANLRESMAKRMAMIQKGQEFENLSGVSGYGLSADGRKPQIHTDKFDYAPLESVRSAFGDLPDIADSLGLEKHYANPAELKKAEAMASKKLWALELKYRNEMQARINRVNALQRQGLKPAPPAQQIAHPMARFFRSTMGPEQATAVLAQSLTNGVVTRK